MPQGYLASGDAYTHRFLRVTFGVENVRRVIDDIIIYSESIEDLFNRTAETRLEKTLLGNAAWKKWYTAESRKFVFCQKSVSWAGF